MNVKYDSFRLELKMDIEEEHRLLEQKKIGEFKIWLEPYLNNLIDMKSKEYDVIFNKLKALKIKRSGESLKVVLNRIGFNAGYIDNSILINL